MSATVISWCIKKKKALEEGARIMAVTYFLKDQKFHFPACSEELPAAAHKQKIPLTHQKLYDLCWFSVQWISRVFYFFFSFSYPFSLFVILWDISGSLGFSCPSLWLYTARDISLIAIFQVHILSVSSVSHYKNMLFRVGAGQTYLSIAVVLSPAGGETPRSHSSSSPISSPPPQWNGKENQCKTCMLKEKINN